MRGDCLEKMAGIPDGSVDMVCCDPPYGTTACAWDSVIPFEPMWEQLTRLIKPAGAIVLTSQDPFSAALVWSNKELYKYRWIWQKDNGSNFFAAKFMPLNNFEDVLVFSQGGINNGCKLPMVYNPQGAKRINKTCTNGVSVGGMVGGSRGARKSSMVEGKQYTQDLTGYPTMIQKFARDTGALHPTQKPVKLMEYLVKTYTNEGEVVLDFTMGSGTTGVACVNTRRRFIGIEQNKEYFEIAKQRIKKAKNAPQRFFV